MRGILVVESEADYKKWFDETAKLSGATVVDGQSVAPASSLVANH
jgi:heme/copper-type cytochrome/quinol oxidase subunit 2